MLESTHTILVVEDDPAARRLLEAAAAETQVANLELATTVREALEHFPARGEDTSEGDAPSPPDLLVLDLDLPGKSGMAFLEELKTCSTSLRRVPVVILSSNDDQATIDRAYDLGANAYLTKPDDYNELVALLEKLEAFWLSDIEQPSY